MIEIAEIAAKARNLSRNTHDGIAIEEYLLRQLPALSSAAVAGGEATMANEAPERIWLSEQPSYWEDNIGTVFLFENGSHNTEYIRADLATLSSEQAREALTELDQLRDRVKELEKALLLIETWSVASAACNTYGQLDKILTDISRTARRVREGGEV